MTLPESRCVRSTLVALFIGLLSRASLAITPDGDALLRSAIDAMGGEAALRAIKAIKIDSIGHRYLIEQSERPEGPWIAAYQQTIEVRDHEGHRLRRAQETRNTQAAAWTGTVQIVAGGVAAIVARGRTVPGGPAQVTAADETLAFAPERLLFTALEATDRRSLPDQTIQGVTQQAMTFTWRGDEVRLYLNAYTHLPTALDVVRDDGSGIWGDVTTRTLYSYWSLEPGGARLPHQMNVEWNGTPSIETTAITVTLNPPAEADTFAIPDEVKRTFNKDAPAAGLRTFKLGQGGAKPIDLADGVTLLPGPWNVTLVKQSDGIVVIEAPIGSGYSSEVIAEVKKRYPGDRIKTVVTTSDAWPHLGGVREYVAEGIRVHALDLNRPILERLLAARHRAHPDALARTPRKPQFAWVTQKTIIGDGSNQVVVYPMRGENGERMLFAHLPARKLAYASDQLQKNRDGSYFMPEYLQEFLDALRREQVAGVETVFAMHLGPTPMTEIEGVLAKIRQP